VEEERDSATDGPSVDGVEEYDLGPRALPGGPAPTEPQEADAESDATAAAPGESRGTRGAREQGAGREAADPPGAGPEVASDRGATEANKPGTGGEAADMGPPLPPSAPQREHASKGPAGRWRTHWAPGPRLRRRRGPQRGRCR
jgi:hypothetical protein